MAEFSKQYCELHDMGFEGDFDIMEEYHKVKPGSYVPYICEGFGFIAIGKWDDQDETCIRYIVPRCQFIVFLHDIKIM